MQPELTLESLATRVATLERKVALRDGIVPASRDWREVIGVCELNEVTRNVMAEMEAAREAEREAARADDPMVVAPLVDVGPRLLTAIATLPVSRVVRHCASDVVVSPFDQYADCPACGRRVKARSYTAGAGLEDLFDAVFTWMQQPGAAQAARRRMRELAADE